MAGSFNRDASPLAPFDSNETKSRCAPEALAMAAIVLPSRCATSVQRRFSTFRGLKKTCPTLTGRLVQKRGNRSLNHRLDGSRLILRLCHTRLCRNGPRHSLLSRRRRRYRFPLVPIENKMLTSVCEVAANLEVPVKRVDRICISRRRREPGVVLDPIN